MGKGALVKKNVQHMKSYQLNYLKNILVPCLCFSAITGVVTSALVFAFKYVAGFVFRASEAAYDILLTNPILIPACLFVLVAVSVLSGWIQQVCPNTNGGGIPTAIVLLRGLTTFRWLRSLIGTVCASLITFFIGVPLGNEGPCVLMGTAVGDGTASLFGKKNNAWRRYVMTGGASCGFAVATGAPISGIFFALEEAHQRFSPMLIMVACSSVSFGMLTAELLSKLTGVELLLFGELSPATFELSQIWIPAVIGILIGVFSIAFGQLYRLFNIFWNRKLKALDIRAKFSFIYTVTLAAGLLSFKFIGTGHDLVLQIMEGKVVWYLLFAIIAFRSVLTLCANHTGVTGGLFLPTLALGTCVSALAANALIALGAIDQSYYLSVILLGLTATLAAMIKTPITAIVFSLEVLSGVNNLLYLVIAVTFAYLVTEAFNVKSVNESVIKTKLDGMNAGKKRVVIDTYVTVMPNTFVIGKSIRDILWPSNLFVLSVKPDEKKEIIDKDGDKHIHEGDTLHIRFQTFDLEATKQELFCLIGEQDLSETVAQKI